MASTPRLPQNSSDRYTLEGLHQEIAKDENWRTNFRYLPNIRKAGLEFHLENRNTGSGKKLLVGYDKSNGRARAYALLNVSVSGLFSLVDVHLSGHIRIGMNRAPKGDDMLPLHSIDYVEPFDQPKAIGTIKWCKSLRYLVLYYFLEQGLIERSVFSNDGLEALKKTCTSIADKSVRMGNKTNRPRLVVPKNNQITDAQTQPSVDEDNSLEEPYIERKTLSAVPLKAPENPSLRALDTMMQQDDDIAARVLSNTMVGHLNLKMEYKPVSAVPMIACQPKRKRPASDDATREDEKQNSEDPVLLYGRLKRVLRNEIEGLEKTESALQDALNAQTMSLNKTLKSKSSLKKALLDAEARVEAEQATKAATETELNKVETELNDKRKFEKRVDSLYT